MNKYAFVAGLLLASTSVQAAPPESWTDEEARTCQTHIRDELETFDRAHAQNHGRRVHLMEDVSRQNLILDRLARSITPEEKIELRTLATKLRSGADAAANERINAILNPKLEALGERFSGVQCKRSAPMKMKTASNSTFRGALPEVPAEGEAALPMEARKVTMAYVIRAALEKECAVENSTLPSWSLVAEFQRPVLAREVGFVFDGTTIQLVAGTAENRNDTELLSIATLDLLADTLVMTGNTVESSIDSPFHWKGDSTQRDSRLIFEGKRNVYIEKTLNDHAWLHSLHCGTYFTKSLNVSDPRALLTPQAATQQLAPPPVPADQIPQPETSHPTDAPYDPIDPQVLNRTRAAE